MDLTLQAITKGQDRNLICMDTNLPHVINKPTNINKKVMSDIKSL